MHMCDSLAAFPAESNPRTACRRRGSSRRGNMAYNDNVVAKCENEISAVKSRKIAGASYRRESRPYRWLGVIVMWQFSRDLSCVVNLYFSRCNVLQRAARERASRHARRESRERIGVMMRHCEARPKEASKCRRQRVASRPARMR